MAPIVLCLAAALGVGQVPTQEPEFGFQTATGYVPPDVVQTKGVNKPSPFATPLGTQGGGLGDYNHESWLDYTLDTLSDTAELLGDVVSAMWPFQTWNADMALPSPHYLEHPPQYFAPSPSFPLSNELAQQQRAWSAPAPLPVPAAAMPTSPYGSMTIPAPGEPPVCLSGHSPVPNYPMVSVGMPVQTLELRQVGGCGMPAPQVLPNPTPVTDGHSVFLQTVTLVPCSVPPTPPVLAKTTIKIVPKGDHHVLTISQGESTLVCKKTTIVVAGQDLVFTTGPSRVHVHGRSFEASATQVTTQTDDTLLLEGDVHLNCDDHGKAMVYKGSKAVVELKGDQINLVVGEKR